MTTAFQQDAFQQSAFQTLAGGSIAFLTGAFQFGAFQTGRPLWEKIFHTSGAWGGSSGPSNIWTVIPPNTQPWGS